MTKNRQFSWLCFNASPAFPVSQWHIWSCSALQWRDRAGISPVFPIKPWRAPVLSVFNCRYHITIYCRCQCDRFSKSPKSAIYAYSIYTACFLSIQDSRYLGISLILSNNLFRAKCIYSCVRYWVRYSGKHIWEIKAASCDIFYIRIRSPSARSSCSTKTPVSYTHLRAHET